MCLSARHLSACLCHVSASGAITAAATANSRRLSQQNPYKNLCFIGRAWPNFPSFYSTFRKKSQQKSSPRYRRVCHGVPHTTPSRGPFSKLEFARQPRGRQYRTIRLPKAPLLDVSSADLFGTDTVSTVWRCRAWKVGRGGCD